jgi:two-component system alkaline phosphatase synthesis response regulator PhoP
MSISNIGPAIPKTLPEAYRLENPTGYGRILLAEDDSLLRELISEGLTVNGYRVDCAANGEDAWNSLCIEDYDLLITDNSMPRLTGVELLRRLKTSPFDLPAILISGIMPPKSAELNQLLSHGAALAKPFSLEQLVMMIETVLDSQSPTEK